MKNQAKLMLEYNSHACESEQGSPQPSNIVDDEHVQMQQTASQDSQISTSNQPVCNSNGSSSNNLLTTKNRRKRKRRGNSTHRTRELTPLSTESEEDELPLSKLVRRPSTISNQSEKRTKFTCQECSEEFDKIYLYETHKETVHSSYPVDASPNIDTIKIITHSGNENILKFKCKLCTFQSESQWETRRHQSTSHEPPIMSSQDTAPPKSRPSGQKLVKVLSLNAIAERVPMIKNNKNLTEDQKLKIFYGFSCSRCKPPLDLSSLHEFEKHSEEMHNLTDISWLCCDVKFRNVFLPQHLNYHLGLPHVNVGNDNILYKSSHSMTLNAIKNKKLRDNAYVEIEPKEKKQDEQPKKVKKGGWPKGKPRTKKIGKNLN